MRAANASEASCSCAHRRSTAGGRGCVVSSANARNHDRRRGRHARVSRAAWGGGCARCVDASAQCVMRKVRTFDINRLQLVLEVKHRPCGLAVRGAARDAVNGFSSHHALDRRDVRVRGRLLLQGTSRGACARRARHGGVTELDSRPCGTCRAPPRARRASTMETRARGGTFRFAARLCVFRDRKIDHSFHSRPFRLLSFDVRDHVRSSWRAKRRLKKPSSRGCQDQIRVRDTSSALRAWTCHQSSRGLRAIVGVDGNLFRPGCRA